MSEILKLYQDNEEIVSLEKLLEGYDSTKILIPTSQLNLGDRITTVYDEKDPNYSEAVFLSIEHKNLYKNLNIEAEFSFVSGQEKIEKNFEIVFRAASRWNKSYTVDEYYVVGIKDSKFYLAMVSYHEEGTNSYAYKRIMNINPDKTGIITHFLSLNADQIKKLFLDSYELKYDEKYVLRCEIVDKLITVKLTNSSKQLDSQYPWVTIFENVNIDQTLEELSNRTNDLENIVSVVEPFSMLDGKGFFGFTVPNSHTKLFRYEIIPLDNDIEIIRYTDEEYSKQVSTEFARFYTIGKQLKFNSSTSLEDIKNEFQEFRNITKNEIVLDRLITNEDINKIQANNIKLVKDKNYSDKFVDIISSFTDTHNGSILKALVDPDETNYYGQNDAYYSINELTDGVSTVYDVPEEFFDKLSLYDNGKVGDVLLEVDSDILYNDFYEVGIQKNPNKFIDYNRLEKLYAGRKFYMETNLRGISKIFEMGALGNGKFLFDIDEEFTKANNSYDAIWKYNLSNFADTAVQDYATVILSVSGANIYYPTAFEFMRTTSLLANSISGYSASFGYSWASMEKTDLETLRTKTTILPDFNIYSQSLDQDIKNMLDRGVKEDYIRVVLSYFRSTQFDEFTDLLLLAKDYSLEFNTSLESFIAEFGGGPYTTYKTFRELWIRDLDYNSQIGTNGIENRKFYMSVNQDEYTLDRDTLKLSFNYTPDSGKAMAVRVYYDNIITLTDSYNKNDVLYKVSESIKKLYDKTNAEKGIVELLEFYDPKNYKLVDSNGLTYVIIPKTLNERGGQLYADIQCCGPFIEKSQNVKRKVIAPLKKVKELLVNDFETSQYNKYFYYTDTYISLSGQAGISGWNREDDLFDFSTEFISGSCEISAGDVRTFEYDYPRSFPISESNVDYGYLNTYPNINFPSLSGSFWSDLLTGSVVGSEVIDQYLDVYKWFDVYNSKLSPFYRMLLKDIIRIKSLNRKYENKETIPDNADPFVLGNWLDGFYTGDRTAWVDITTPAISAISGWTNADLEFARFVGHPWGTENSRKQMIDQLRNTLDDKFLEHELYYVDLSDLLYYESFRSTDIQDSEFIDVSVYPTSGNSQLIDNPFVNENLKYYVIGQTITGSDGNVIFSEDSFVSFTDISTEFDPDKTEAYSDISKTTYQIVNIVRPIVNNVDMFWKFNSSLLFESLPTGVEVNAEYEYSQDPTMVAKNIPENISQKVNLGISDGSAIQKFPNPDVLYSKNVNNSQVNKIWLDNYDVTEFNVFNLGTYAKVSLDSLTNFTEEKDISIDYKMSNYYDLQKENLFLDNFHDRREFSWLTLTKDETGYTKATNPYAGYVVDDSKLEGEYLFHLYEFESQAISGYYKVNDTTNSSTLIHPIQLGYDIENIIGVIDYKRSNNFELSVDIYFDDDIERGLMQTDLIFKGKFGNFNGKQYFTDFYSVSLGLENSNIALIARQADEIGQIQTQMLAKVTDKYSILKRNQFYTLKVKVIKDVAEVFFNERNQKEVFFFSFNLKHGHTTQNEEIVASNAVGGLGVAYESPEFYIDGSRIGFRTMCDKVNFSNFKIKALEENNEIFGDMFEVNNYDQIVSMLKKKYGVVGEVKKFKKTSNGYDYLQIEDRMFARQNGGTFVIHYMLVEDFDIIGEYVYIREKVNNSLSDFTVINVYKDLLKLVNNIIVSGKSFINEPIISYLTNTERVVSEIKEVDGRLFITTAVGCNFAKTWDMFNGCVWEEVQSIWYVYGC